MSDQQIRFDDAMETSLNELCRVFDPSPRVARVLDEETRRTNAVRFDDAMEPSNWVRHRGCDVMTDVISTEFPEGGPIHYLWDGKTMKAVYARPRRGR